MRFRLNKAYLIIGIVAIFMLAALLSGPLIRKRAREKTKQPAPTTQTEATRQEEQRDASPAPAAASH